MIGEEITQVLTNIGWRLRFISFSGNLDIESLDWIYEVEKFFDMTYISVEKYVKLNGGAAAW